MKPQALIAANTLGMGARPGEIEACKSDPKGWVISQVKIPAPLIAELVEAPSSMQLMNARSSARKKLGKRLRGKQKAAAFSDRQKVLNGYMANHNRELGWRFKQAVQSPTSFVERWMWFWCNRFTVSARDNHLKMAAGAFEREAIRPHIFGRFEDMLVASTLHPAMIYYLDNGKSVGPKSAIARKSKGKHNENLAREVLELHTMGVGGGYTIDDITSLSYGLTGWTRAKKSNEYKTVFMRNRHQRGAFDMLGKTYETVGPERIHNMLGDLAKHKSTARHIAQQLATHFIGGSPKPVVIQKLVNCFLETDGDLKELALCLIGLDETWKQDVGIFKRPDEFIVSAARALPEWQDNFNPKIAKLLGQPLLQASGPDGWSQTGDNWINTENILIRLGWLRRSLETLPSWINAAYFMEEALGGHVSRQTAKVLNKSLLRNELLTLGLMSPEFLRR